MQKRHMLKLVFSVCLTVVLACLLILPGCAKEAPAPETLTVKFVSAHIQGTTTADCLEYFMDRVTEKSGGAITWDVYWATLGSALTYQDLIAKGVADVGMTGCGYKPGAWPLGGFEYLFPFSPTDPGLVLKAKRAVMGAVPEIEEEYARNNVVCLGLIPWPTYGFFSDEPIKNLADLEGKKIIQYGLYFGQITEAGGAVSVRGTVGEFYEALRSGVADIIHIPLDTGVGYKYYEVAPYYIEISWGAYIPPELWMNLDFFNSVTPDQQEIFLEAGRAMEEFTVDYMTSEWDAALVEFNKQGGTFIEFNEKDRLTWINNCPDIAAVWAAEKEKEGLPGWEIVDSYQEECSKLGFEWPRKWGVR